MPWKKDDAVSVRMSRRNWLEQECMSSSMRIERMQFGKWISILISAAAVVVMLLLAVLLVRRKMVEGEEGQALEDDASCNIIMPLLREEVPRGRMCISIMSMTSVS